MNMLPYSGIPALPKNIEDMHNQLVALGLNDVEALTARIKKCEDWVDAVEETELTGNPVVFQNALAVPAASLEATIEPIQPLHGYDHPWAGGAGKNKLPMTVAGIKAANTWGTWTGNVYSIQGGQVEILTDDDSNITGFKVSGTFTNTAWFGIPFTIPANTYILSGCPAGGAFDTYSATIRDAIGGANISEINDDRGSGSTFTISETLSAYYNIRINSGYSVPSGGLVFKSMLRLSTVTDPTFAPYSNICPISGRTETSITTTNEDESESSSVIIQLGQTVYGGQVDFKTGVVTIDRASKTLGESDYSGLSGNGKRVNLGVTGVRNAASDTVADDILISNLLPTLASNSTYSGNYGVSVNTVGVINIATGETLTEASAKQFLTDNSVQIVYPLATPTELTLTPAQLQMLKGYNSVSSDDASSLTVTAYTGGPWGPITRAIKKVTNKTKTTKKRRK